MALSIHEIQHQQTPLDDVFDALAVAIKGFERRREQYELAMSIYSAIYYKTNLVCEAPTGTGKSFAACTPLVCGIAKADAHLWKQTDKGISYDGRRAIIATANNNLLEQYCKKDLPFLEGIFPEVKWAKAKGKANFACMARAEKIFGQQLLFATKENEGMEPLQRWYDSTQSGDKEELTSVKEEQWGRINVDDSCNGRNCGYYDECFYYCAKRKSTNSNVIATNLDLFLMDLFMPQMGLLPKYDVVIIDEAHQLEAKAINQKEKSFTEVGVARFITRAQRAYDVRDNELVQIRTAVNNLFNAYRTILGNDDRKSIVPDPALKMLTEEFIFAMKSLRQLVGRCKVEEGSREKRQRDSLMESISSAGNAALSVITHHELEAAWVEKTKSDIKVVTCPFRIDGLLRSMLFDREDLTVVCMSATLATGKKGEYTRDANGSVVEKNIFHHYFDNCGAPKNKTAIYQCGSPFDYRQNCAIYLPTAPLEAQDPNSEKWKAWAKSQMTQLVQISNGGALILATSARACKEYAEWLTRMTTLDVAVQGGGMPNSQLVDWLRDAPANGPGRVLIGTASFWEGVSVEGDALRLVIIDKIPFTSHGDPIQQAREEWYKADPERSKRAFNDLQVAPAIIKTKQGFGRLIRTKSDRGVVALLDPRLTSKGYGKQILKALPDAPQVKDINAWQLKELLDGIPF